ncbi:MAG: LacI family transcriptional regulator [Chloroflexota bacterium]|nr:LacI family transcriptional regulator [Chloroflexota bacterium]
MQNLTLEEIGKRAGVSRSTVSRVINNQENVSPTVRERVLKVIEETGYHPHAAARSLAAQRTHVIGLIIPRTVQSIFADPYFPRLIQGIAQACNAREYTLSLFMFHTEAEEQDLYPRVLSRGLTDGVIISSSLASDPLIPRLLDSNLPFVIIGRPLVEGPVNYVDVDNLVGAHNAVTHLIRLGRRRIGHIAGPSSTSVGHDRRQGYVDALVERGLPVRDELMVEGDFLETSGYLAARRLMATEVDAIFAASDKMAFGALRALREAGRRVPHDVAVIGFDDLEASATTQPPLTTVRQPIRQSGVIAVETLLDIVENGKEATRRLILPTQLVIRESCGAISRDH